MSKLKKGRENKIREHLEDQKNNSSEFILQNRLRDDLGQHSRKMAMTIKTIHLKNQPKQNS